ncbi:hypothetical protein [Pseudoalteromonas sp. MMG005]|uniref:hypothetical protein n=1 Tax=Pseudoalteromonas sp. MMG005 TaxID=2822682 RepID=UPI001B3A270B|nr:hypothetical protein [Pseudoalteromonas sp. MMG005]MBQ4844487.1 hypothetical protein [Pseudoalteromonas sp. MMG005]
MFKPYSLSFLIFLWVFPAYAAQTPLYNAPFWLDENKPNSLTMPTQYLRLAENYSQTVFVPEGNWLEVPAQLLNAIDLWQGSSVLAMRKINASSLTCHNERCQLPAMQSNQFIKFTNTSTQSQRYEIWLGQYHHHRSPFRRSLKLPLKTTRLKLAQDHETYYNLEDKEQITTYFAHAKKLKVTVRKTLHNLDKRGTISLYVNQQPVSILNIGNSQASEYIQQKVSTANTDYIALPKDSYLTIKSHGPALIKLEQMQRGIRDSNAAQQYQEANFNPYWVNNLNTTLSHIYLDERFDDFMHFNFAKANPIEKRRYQDLMKTISTQRFVFPTPNNDPGYSETQEISIVQGQRKVLNHLYTSSLTRDALVHRLKGKLAFDWSHLSRVRSYITLFVRTPIDTTLNMKAPHKNFTIALKASQHFIKLTVPLPQDVGTVEFSTQHQNSIELALQVDDLLTLPNNELLYVQKGKLKDKLPALNTHINTQIQRTADAYINGLTPYTNHSQETVSNPDPQLSIVHSHQLLGNALQLLKSNPLEALPILKHLVTNPHFEVKKNAWQLRIKALESLNQQRLAQSYLEGLLLSSDQKLKLFAAAQLIEIYKRNKNSFQLQGLCAVFYTALEICPPIAEQLLLSQQKYLDALWLVHDKQDILHLNPLPLQVSNYRSVSKAHLQEPPYYQISHYGSSTIFGETSHYSAFNISKGKGLTLTAKRDLTLQLRARAPWQESHSNGTQWLHLDLQKTQSIVPIFSDIASTAQIPALNTRLSIASESIVTLQAGEQLYIHSDMPTSVSINTLHPQSLGTLPPKTANVPFLFSRPFDDLINDPSLSLQTLLTNALWRLESQSLLEHEFILLFTRLAIETLPTELATLMSRVKHFGHWQTSKHYSNYAGTQLIDTDAILKRSLAEQVNRHSSKNIQLDGVLLRPHHTLYLDMSELQTLPIKLKFTFAPTELLPNQYANILIETGDNHVLWPVTPNSPVEYALNNTEHSDSQVMLNWVNPYVSQLLNVSVLVFREGYWQDVDLDTKQLFYYATQKQPTTLKLNRDQLLKIETINAMQRTEKVVFHPAGTLTLPSTHAQLARVFTWQLKPNKHTLVVSPPATPLAIVQPKLIQQPTANEFINNTLKMDGNLTHVEGFMRYSRSGIFETNEPLPANHNLDFGIRLRNNNKQHWYRLEIAYSLSNHNYDTYVMNAVHNWQDDNSHWFSETALFNRWQDSSDITQSQYAGLARFRVGESWRNDKSDRHQWWWQPFYYYTSVDTQTYLDDLKINPSIFGFYRQDHMNGWQAEYEYRYQPWVDNQLSFRMGGISNQNWHSFDNVYFSATTQQYYQGQIFAAQLQSIYKFADENRPNDTWQYLTQLSWQTLYDFSNNTAGWVKLSWTQDWFNNEHAIGFEVNLGNLQNTGFTPFAHDEILFQSLQLSHFAEQDIYGH